MTKQVITRRSVMVGTVAMAAVLIPMPLSSEEVTVHEVEISSFEFIPAVLQVRVGDTVRWTNKDLAPHTATADEFGWDTGQIEHGKTSEILIQPDMENTYFCVFHPHMKGRVEIVR